MLLSKEETKAIFAPKPRFGIRIQVPQVGDDSLGWKMCRAVAASNIRYEKEFKGLQVIHQGGAKRKPGTPPHHMRSIDFSSLVRYGKPTPANRRHFKALVKVKKGVWSDDY